MSSEQLVLPLDDSPQLSAFLKIASKSEVSFVVLFLPMVELPTLGLLHSKTD